MDALDAVLSSRLQETAGHTIQDVARRAPGLRRLSQKLGAAIAWNRPLLVQLLKQEDRRRELTDRMALGLFEFLSSQYQYLELGDAQLMQIKGLYWEFVLELLDWLARWDRRSIVCPPLSVHHDRLAQWVREALRGVDALSWADHSDARVVCGTYTAEFQLQLLGLDSTNLAEPILDLGCGPNASLVKHLQELGYSAFGVDRSARSGVNITCGSWFDLALEPGTWGTIIAHHSFSLHLLNAHGGSMDRVLRYVRHFMSILHSLKLGGRFVYAPGLPFLEHGLDAHFFDVSAKKIRGISGSTPAGFEWSSTTITRNS